MSSLTCPTSPLADSSIFMLSLADVSNQPIKSFSFTNSSILFESAQKPCFS